LITQLSRIGENLKAIDDGAGDLRSDIPEIGEIIGMRNFLVHDYDEIDLDLVWRAATTLAPALRVRLVELLDSPRFAND
jgi:uncharacterized protein with HEPN domain